MTTVQTAKAIRVELKAKFPEYKFSVRKFSSDGISIEYNGDKNIRPELDSLANSYKGWSEFNTNYVWVNPYGTAVA